MGKAEVTDNSKTTSSAKVSGIHHITAIASDPQNNLDFYVGVLGLRFIKRTVNFDDPGTYHFYYGDEVGNPGNVLTFFPWPGAVRGKKGAGFVSAISFRVPLGSLEFWEKRLVDSQVKIVGNQLRYGAKVLQFEDPDGLILECIESADAESRPFWNSGVIQSQCALRGFHSVTITTQKALHTANLLEEKFGFKKSPSEEVDSSRLRYVSGCGDIVDLLIDPSLPFGELGAGIVHHIALRARDGDQQLAWKSMLDSAGFSVTEVRERNYFQSIYFRERSGVLFEIATDGPGFGIDEAPSALGAGLKLPSEYEHYRDSLYQKLPGLHVPSPQSPNLALHAHLFETASNVLDEETVLLLHGTGGDEKSMLSLGRSLSERANLLSPKGNVLEGLQNRFFKRLAEGIFDQEDLRFRSGQLADWLAVAQASYKFDNLNITALGFSNGANIAAAMLLLGQALFKRAILVCAMPPFEASEYPDLSGYEILLIAGKRDPMVSVHESKKLAIMLEQAGAKVTLEFFDCGHTLTEEGVVTIRGWLRN